MFSKISAMLGPSQRGGNGSGGDAGQNRKRPAEENVEGAVETGDLVLLSINAVRALVQEEESLQPQAQELLRKLTIIEQHGLQSLPVRGTQAVADAIREAASFFGSAR
ncbi:MAG: hypothetical protein PSY14_11575 [bacterium]|nr:hypothetical protein [bacterium]